MDYSQERAELLLITEMLAAGAGVERSLGTIRRDEHQRVEPDTLESGRKAVMAR